jgi:hypothetical protein
MNYKRKKKNKRINKNVNWGSPKEFQINLGRRDKKKFLIFHNRIYSGAYGKETADR